MPSKITQLDLKGILLLILFFTFFFVCSQQLNTSTLSYHHIENIIENSKSDSIKERFSNILITKGKVENNLEKINKGYNYLLEIYSHSQKGVEYADSIIQTAKKMKDENLTSRGYLKKGIELFYIAKYKPALKNYMIANNFALKKENSFLRLKIKHYIASLKNAVHEKEEALKLFKENLLFFNDSNIQRKHPKQYLRSLFSLSNSYNANHLPDSSLTYTKIGIKESLKETNKYLYPFFVLSSGVSLKLKNQYNTAIDSLLKGISLLKNQKKALSDSYFFLSEAYSMNNEKIKSIKYLKKIDSIYDKDPTVISRAKKANILLLKYYEKINDPINQLKSIKKAIKIDSIIHVEHKDLNKKIIKEYEIPNLLLKKEQLIKRLNKENTASKNWFIILIFTSCFLIIFSIVSVKKNINNKKKYHLLIKNSQTNPEKSNITKTVTATGLSEDLVKSIQLALEKFENSNKFTKKKYTLHSLAKELKTNSSYLSKVINSTKNSNFSNYINNLKIDFAIKKLTEDKKFRSYTIKAIAEEVGFNKAQSFSTAFNKKTGINPSYFIKQLNTTKTIKYSQKP